MKRPMFIVVKGATDEWIFAFRGDPKHLEEWRADGLAVHVREAVVPAWIAGTWLAGPLVWIQRAWQWIRIW